tara:strand:- start:3995 stop:4210 length:216 start_codon:yes stop_codon:yes gene_type:complete
MNNLNEVEEEYEGLNQDNLVIEQIEIAVRALHVIAVMHEGDPSFMSSIAIDALKEMETSGYHYDSYTTDYL